MAGTAPIIDGTDREDFDNAHIPWWKIWLQRKFRLKSRTPMPKVCEEIQNCVFIYMTKTKENISQILYCH